MITPEERCRRVRAVRDSLPEGPLRQLWHAQLGQISRAYADMRAAEAVIDEALAKHHAAHLAVLHELREDQPQ